MLLLKTKSPMVVGLARWQHAVIYQRSYPKPGPVSPGWVTTFRWVNNIGVQPAAQLNPPWVGAMSTSLHKPYSWLSFQIAMSDVEWLSKICNYTFHGSDDPTNSLIALKDVKHQSH